MTWHGPWTLPFKSSPTCYSLCSRRWLRSAVFLQHLIVIHRCSGNPNFYQTLHKSPQLDPKLSQVSPLHTMTLFSNVHFNIIRPSTPSSTKWSLPIWLSEYTAVYIYLLPYARRIFSPHHHTQSTQPVCMQHVQPTSSHSIHSASSCSTNWDMPNDSKTVTEELQGKMKLGCRWEINIKWTSQKGVSVWNGFIWLRIRFHCDSL